MKLKFEGQIDTGKLKIYEENNINSPLYVVDTETDDNENFKMRVKNKDNEPISEVLYKEDIHRKFLMVRDYVIHDFRTNERIKAKAETGKKIVFGEDNEMYLTRSIRDRKMCFYNKNELIMILKCSTIIRNWLRGNYVAEILDQNYAPLCICVIAVALKVIFDEHNCTSFNI